MSGANGGRHNASGGQGPPRVSASGRGVGAGDGSRTRDMQLGRLPLYQLSYSRPRFRPIRAHRERITLKSAIASVRKARGQRITRNPVEAVGQH